jgi:hypothetical protein
VSPAQVRPRQLVTRFNPLFLALGSSRFVVQCTRRRVRGGNAASPRNRRHLSGLFRRERRCSRLRRIAGFPRLKADSAPTRCHDAAFNAAGVMLKIWLVFLFCLLLRRNIAHFTNIIKPLCRIHAVLRWQRRRWVFRQQTLITLPQQRCELGSVYQTSGVA